MAVCISTGGINSHNIENALSIAVCPLFSSARVSNTLVVFYRLNY